MWRSFPKQTSSFRSSPSQYINCSSRFQRIVRSPVDPSTMIMANWFVALGSIVTEETSTPSWRRELRENWPISSSPTFPIYFVLTPHRLKATMAVATWPPPCLENRSISIFVLTVGNCGTTLRKSTELRPIPTTSKGLFFGKGILNRTVSFTEFLPVLQVLANPKEDATQPPSPSFFPERGERDDG